MAPLSSLERFAVIGTIAGGTGNLAQALYFDHPVVVSTVIGSLVGGALGALYGHVKKRLETRRS